MRQKIDHISFVRFLGRENITEFFLYERSHISENFGGDLEGELLCAVI